MKVANKIIFSALALSMLSCGCTSGSKVTGGGEENPEEPTVVSDVEYYVTTANKARLFDTEVLNFDKGSSMSPNTITLDPATKYQTLEGFGSAITGSAAYNLLKMSQEDRTAFLTEVFHPTAGLGSSSIRISIGCSDFSLDEYTCEDVQGEWRLHEYDTRDLIPVLHEILAINPDIKILGSPWTAPQWMKVSDLQSKAPHFSWKSGHLNPDHYDEYALYFVRWIEEMAKHNITIDAITIQNEPLNRGNSASMYMGWREQRDFIKTALGPAFEANNITAKILAFDHNFNYDNIEEEQGYPMNIYGDSEASKYVDGAAYHAYGGNVSEMGRVHSAHPDKNLYFTEMSIGTWGSGFSGDLLWNMKDVFIGSVNNFSKNVIVWNLMLDSNRGPNRPDGGCTTCYGVVDISSADYKTIDRQSHYYNIAHMSKVIKPGAVRIGISEFSHSGLHYTAALNPDGSYAVVVVNESKDQIDNVTFQVENRSFTVSFAPESIASFRFAL